MSKEMSIAAAAGSSARAATAEAEPNPQRWRVLAVLLTGVFMALIAVSIVNVALPSIQSDFGARNADVQWVLSGYALTFGVVLVSAGRAGDLLGRGGMYLIGIAIYTGAAVFAGFAPNVTALNIARLLMGIGAGFFNPQAVGMIQQYFTGHERGKAFGYFGTVVGIAVAIGSPLGGFLIRIGGEDLGWRLTMLVNVPFGVLAIILGLILFPRPLLSPIRNTSSRPVNPFTTILELDPLGALILGAVVLCTMLPFMESGVTPWVWCLLVLAVVLLAVWIKWEKYLKSTSVSPMVDLDIFKIKGFRNGAIIAGLWFFGSTSIWVLVAQYFQNALGHSALVSGLIALPAAMLSSFTANWAGRKVDALGRSIVIVGIAISATGLALTVCVIWLHQSLGISEFWTIVPLTLSGAATGLVISPNQTLSLRDVPVKFGGTAGAVMQTGQRIGTSVGLAIILAVTFAVKESNDWTVGVAAGFGTIVVIFLSTLAVAIKDLRTERASRCHLTQL